MVDVVCFFAKECCQNLIGKYSSAATFLYRILICSSAKLYRQWACQRSWGAFRTRPPQTSDTSVTPPDDLGPYQALKTPTHKATYNRLALLAATDKAAPIAALSGEKKVRLSAVLRLCVNAKPRGDLSRRGCA